MNKEILKSRTKAFALSCIRLSQLLPANHVGWIFTDQIVRSSTSVAANYRAVCRSKSNKDFVSKLETVIEEADETKFWLEMIADAELQANAEEKIGLISKEAEELIAIFVASVKTVKTRMNNESK